MDQAEEVAHGERERVSLSHCLFMTLRNSTLQVRKGQKSALPMTTMML